MVCRGAAVESGSIGRPRGGVRAAIGAALATAVLAAGCAPDDPIRRVVLITIDTTRADSLGCYGRANAKTPTLDALAERGVLFERAFSPAPLTLPSHASLMTGQDPPRHGVRSNSTFRLSAEVPTLTLRAREAGMTTAAFVSAAVLDRDYGLASGFDVYDDQMGFLRADAASRVRAGFAERKAADVVDAAVAWLDGAPDRFLLWVHLYDPHHSYDPPPPFDEEFADDLYAGEIAYADRELGRLLGAIDERHTDDATLVVVTSDHGESLGQHSEQTHAYTVYEATQHIPLLMAGPGLPVGLRIPAVVELVDVAPTVLELLSLSPLPAVQGESLAPLIRGSRTERSRDTAYVETLAGQIEFGWSPSLGVRSDRYKYIRTLRPELYDLVADPQELRNLAARQPEIAAWHEEQLAARLAAAVGGRSAEALTPDLAQRERLESLGYVVADEPVSERELGEIGGPDPKDMLSDETRRTGHLLRLALKGQPALALAKFERAAPSGYFAQTVGASIAMLAGRHEAAERYARAAIEELPASASGYVLLARALRAQGRLDEARAAIETATELSPGWGEPRTLAGQLAEVAGRTQEAEALYRSAVESRTPDAAATWRWAALLIERGAVAEADAALRRIPPELLTDPEVALRLSKAEERAGRIPAARSWLQKALDVHAGSAQLTTALEQLDAAGPAGT